MHKYIITSFAGRKPSWICQASTNRLFGHTVGPKIKAKYYLATDCENQVYCLYSMRKSCIFKKI